MRAKEPLCVSADNTVTEEEIAVAWVSPPPSVSQLVSVTATPLLSWRDTIKLSPSTSFTTNSKDCSVTLVTKPAASDLLYCLSKSLESEHQKACAGREVRSLGRVTMEDKSTTSELP